MQTTIRVRGMSRLQIWDREGKVVVGDTGWRENTVTNDGLDNYIAATVGKSSGSKQFQYLQLATQTAAVNATQESLLGETRVRKAISPSTIVTGTFQATGSWSSADNTAACTIGGIGMYDLSAAGTLGCGATYTTSQWASNQNISATYQLRFS